MLKSINKLRKVATGGGGSGKDHSFDPRNEVVLRPPSAEHTISTKVGRRSSSAKVASSPGAAASSTAASSTAAYSTAATERPISTGSLSAGSASTGMTGATPVSNGTTATGGSAGMTLSGSLHDGVHPTAASVSSSSVLATDTTTTNTTEGTNLSTMPSSTSNMAGDTTAAAATMTTLSHAVPSVPQHALTDHIMAAAESDGKRGIQNQSSSTNEQIMKLQLTDPGKANDFHKMIHSRDWSWARTKLKLDDHHGGGGGGSGGSGSGSGSANNGVVAVGCSGGAPLTPIGGGKHRKRVQPTTHPASPTPGVPGIAGGGTANHKTRKLLVGRDEFGRTPLHLILQRRSTGSITSGGITLRRAPEDVVLGLLGAAPRAAGIPDVENTYALHVAVLNGHSVDCVRSILRCYPGAVIERNAAGDTPLLLAANFSIAVSASSKQKQSSSEKGGKKSSKGGGSVGSGGSGGSSGGIPMVPFSAADFHHNSSGSSKKSSSSSSPGIGPSFVDRRKAFSSSSRWEIVRMFLQYHPESASIRNRFGMSVLEMSLQRHAPEDVIRSLIRADADAVSIQRRSSEGGILTPLSLAIVRESTVEVLRLVAGTCPSALKMRDDRGVGPITAMWLGWYYKPRPLHHGQQNISHNMPVNTAFGVSPQKPSLAVNACDVSGSDQGENDMMRVPHRRKMLQTLHESMGTELSDELQQMRAKLETLLCASHHPDCVRSHQASSGPLVPPSGKPFRIVHAASGEDCPIEILNIAVLLEPHQVQERDEYGRLPLHVASDAALYVKQTYEPTLVRPVDRLLAIYPRAARAVDASGRLPLHIAIESGKKWLEGVGSIAREEPRALSVPHMGNGSSEVYRGLLPFMVAAVVGNDTLTPFLKYVARTRFRTKEWQAMEESVREIEFGRVRYEIDLAGLGTIFELLRSCPDAIVISMSSSCRGSKKRMLAAMKSAMMAEKTRTKSGGEENGAKTKDGGVKSLPPLLSASSSSSTTEYDVQLKPRGRTPIPILGQPGSPEKKNEEPFDQGAQQHISSSAQPQEQKQLTKEQFNETQLQSQPKPQERSIDNGAFLLPGTTDTTNVTHLKEKRMTRKVVSEGNDGVVESAAAAVAEAKTVTAKKKNTNKAQTTTTTQSTSTTTKKTATAPRKTSKEGGAFTNFFKIERSKTFEDALSTVATVSAGASGDFTLTKPVWTERRGEGGRKRSSSLDSATSNTNANNNGTASSTHEDPRLHWKQRQWLQGRSFNQRSTEGGMARMITFRDLLVKGGGEKGGIKSTKDKDSKKAVTTKTRAPRPGTSSPAKSLETSGAGGNRRRSSLPSLRNSALPAASANAGATATPVRGSACSSSGSGRRRKAGGAGRSMSPKPSPSPAQVGSRSRPPTPKKVRDTQKQNSYAPHPQQQQPLQEAVQNLGGPTAPGIENISRYRDGDRDIEGDADYLLQQQQSGPAASTESNVFHDRTQVDLLGAFWDEQSESYQSEQQGQKLSVSTPQREPQRAASPQQQQRPQQQQPQERQTVLPEMAVSSSLERRRAMMPSPTPEKETTSSSGTQSPSCTASNPFLPSSGLLLPQKEDFLSSNRSIASFNPFEEEYPPQQHQQQQCPQPCQNTQQGSPQLESLPPPPPPPPLHSATPSIPTASAVNVAATVPPSLPCQGQQQRPQQQLHLLGLQKNNGFQPTTTLTQRQQTVMTSQNVQTLPAQQQQQHVVTSQQFNPNAPQQQNPWSVAGIGDESQQGDVLQTMRQVDEEELNPFDAFSDLMVFPSTAGGCSASSAAVNSPPQPAENAPSITVNTSSSDSTERTNNKTKDESKRSRFSDGAVAFYKDSRGNMSRVTILKVHFDDELEPFYTISLPNGNEKQTDDAHLREIDADGGSSSSSPSPLAALSGGGVAEMAGARAASPMKGDGMKEEGQNPFDMFNLFSTELPFSPTPFSTTTKTMKQMQHENKTNNNTSGDWPHPQAATTTAPAVASSQPPQNNKAPLHTAGVNATAAIFPPTMVNESDGSSVVIERGGGRNNDGNLEQQQQQQAPPMLCVLCGKNGRETLLLPCRHLCVCSKCSGSLITENCPMCQTKIISTVDVLL